MWRPTDYIEIRALILAYIHLGAMNQNICLSELIWDTADYIDGPCFGHHRTKSATSHARCICPLLPRERDVPNVHRRQTRRHPWLVANAISPSAKITLHIIVLHIPVDNRNSMTS
ncbi:hypothetical protein RRG08_026734 [Elysia crispata]|uniref:Uncharacterized protein n=1 Tax=Elysia crispata TaxID=231223 RepID=A0AAE1AQH1_9GAST|nr:hypothetical protein RRG08_026734 [Elysia crispata]